jgi:hypothetical protein
MSVVCCQVQVSATGRYLVNVTSCTLVSLYRRFTRSCCFHHQGRQSSVRNNYHSSSRGEGSRLLQNVDTKLNGVNSHSIVTKILTSTNISHLTQPHPILLLPPLVVSRVRKSLPACHEGVWGYVDIVPLILNLCTR